MAYDVARVRGLHPALGDGWMRFDAPVGMVVPESVATSVSTAFRGAATNSLSSHPAALRSAALLDAARLAVADLLNADPSGVVLGADRAILLASLADASSTRSGLGNEVVVSRLDDEANIAPWLRAADRFGAKVKWAEADIETGELPIWQWEELLTPDTRLAAIPSASSTLGTLIDVATISGLVHRKGGLVVVDHSAAAPYRLFDIGAIEALWGSTDYPIYHRIVRVFIGEVRDRVARIAALQESGDLTAIEIEAHSIKGAAGNVGAHAIRDAAMRLEAAVARRDGTAIPPLTETLRRATEAGIVALEQLLTAASGHT